MVNGSEPTTDSPRSPGLQRLFRSWTGRNVVEPTNMPATPSTENVPAASVQPSSNPADPTVPLQRVESTTSSQRRRLSFGDRFRRLSKDIGRFTGGGKGSVSEPTVEATSASGAVSTTQAPENPSGHGKFLSLVAESEEPVGEGVVLAQGSQEPSTEPDSPDSLAKRIQDIIDHLPLPTAGGGTRPIIKPPKPPARDKAGRPIPPPNASPIDDAELIRLLSSATIMNGSREGGRPSIWSVLETISAPPHALPGSPPPAGDGGETNGDEDEDDEVFPVNSSVMMYSPIIPGKKDLVELAELVPVAVEEGPVPGEGEGETPQATSWTSFWPLAALGAPGTSAQPSTSTNPLSGQDTVVSRGRTELNSSGKKVKVHTVRAWVPSKDKLSVQVMWWGYRMYLPPPVLDILSDKTIEAAKRAAMITTALTWFFNNLPISSMPLAIQPTLILLQRLAPYLGYIGTFISWSWGAIKKYDIGYGVTLTATWILPIALIPGTWHEYDFPKSPEPTPPVPLPSEPAPPSKPEPAPTPSKPAPPAAEPPAPTKPPVDAPIAPPADPGPIEQPPPPPPSVPVGTPLSARLLRRPKPKIVDLPPEDEEAVAIAREKAAEREERKQKKRLAFFGMKSS